MNSNQLYEELLLGIAYKFKINSYRYTPVKIESSPFLAIFCIDKKESIIEGREWISKFEILPADLEQLSKEFGVTNFDFSIDSKYQYISHNEGRTIDYPDLED